MFAGLAHLPALLLAVSGGPDSTALLVLAARWRAGLDAGPRLVAATVDHGLRRGAAAEALAVAALAGDLGLAHHTLRWTGDKPAAGLQEAARAARYRLLAEAARAAGAAHVLTAHTRDDQAETVLFRLARGSGVAGLAGMARVSPLPVSGPAPPPARPAGGARDGALWLVRPFLDIPKARLVATLAAAGIPWADDPSNRDPRFTRSRLRGMLPGLAAEGLSAARLAQLAARMRRADAALEAAVERLAADLAVPDLRPGAAATIAAAGWVRAPAELRLRLLGRLVAAAGTEGPVELGKLEDVAEALAAACAGPAPAARFRRTLAGAMVTLSGGRLTIEPAPPRRHGRNAAPAPAGPVPNPTET
ncbi:tRNA lysidine(34) synthetase TilS [Rhodoplanes tepidamans]|uniref:tRNA(Ile)-lysidine synthase n=1 Tax=Rhodoplanes tepidamans TaxID=200616 RepID=A0ABT5J5E5_RHOTP|nr:tRNA lysidine(34) synthetase TilS [Rhodoplanes tepidamans]MDC7784854.1 tRNA lysidine(34) synthetase TilS [Rhodoplanes tepidamans]